jgi:hypothetical protein
MKTAVPEVWPRQVKAAVPAPTATSVTSGMLHWLGLPLLVTVRPTLPVPV